MGEFIARREKLKTRSQWMREAQAAFNAWIRYRDRDKPCISCGATGRTSWDAGHYRSVAAAPSLRFDEDNVHKQCVPCNQHRSGNAIEYRRGLVARIGVERVEWLEREHPPKKYTIDELRLLKQDWRSILKRSSK